MEIDGEYSGIKFSASHFIPGHAKCGRLHGHVYILRMAVHGEKNENGMIMDFIDLKKTLRKIVEDLDHKVLLPGRSAQVTIEVGEEIKITAEGKRYLFPPEDVVILDIAQTSAEELADHVLQQVMKELSFPPNVKKVEIGVDEERGQTAWASQEVGEE